MGVKIAMAQNIIKVAVAESKPLYGINSGFGGMSNVTIPKESVSLLQMNLMSFLKVGTGCYLPNDVVRASMLARVNSSIRGASGLSMDLIERLLKFLNNNITPCVPSIGSIGASGDLIPLSYICGAVMGLNSTYKVHYCNKILSATPDAMHLLNLTSSTTLGPKEGLAMVNGTSVMTGTAALCTYDAVSHLRFSLAIHALMYQALEGSMDSFLPFVHDICKPHPGQKHIAKEMRKLLQGSKMTMIASLGEDDKVSNVDSNCNMSSQISISNHKNEQRIDSGRADNSNKLIQDRYSLRCLSQYLGPILDEIIHIQNSVEVELNSATDNPLIDVDESRIIHSGNFYGGYISHSMDKLRYCNSMIAQHLDAQIALLMHPAFNQNLPPSLCGHQGQVVNMGMKGAQICGNAMTSLIAFYGHSIGDRYATHAEQYNQNINSQGHNSAMLTAEQNNIMRKYIALSLIIAVQAVDLRAYQIENQYNATELLSTATIPIYTAVKELLNRTKQQQQQQQHETRANSSSKEPLVYDDRPLDVDINMLEDDIANEGKVFQTASQILIDYENLPI